MNINPKFKSLIPPLAPEELTQLESNIVADGCRDPLVTWRGTLLDGHNRYDICTRRGIKFETVEHEFETEAHARIWMRNNQRGRRNLPDAWKIELELGNKEDLAELGKKTQGKRTDLLSDNDKKSTPEPKHDTRKEIAKAAGVSTGKVAQAEVVKKKSPELWEKAKSGEITVHAAYRAATVHTMNNSGEIEWYTPEHIITPVHSVLGTIDLDPASSEQANKTVCAKKIFTMADDGLLRTWKGRVFLNPPYSGGLVSKFTGKLLESFSAGDVTEAIVLVNNATETEWFQLLAAKASAICFPSSRIKFILPSGEPKGTPLQGQAIVYLGKSATRFIGEFERIGFVLWVHPE